MTSLNSKLASSLGVLSILGACATSTGPSLQEWQDPLANVFTPPSYESEIDYDGGSYTFNSDLFASMKGNVDVINVDMGNTGIRISDFNRPDLRLVAADPDLLSWTTRIQLSGGKIAQCRNTPPESGLWELLGVVSRFVAGWVEQAQTWQQAKDYNVVLFYDPATREVTSSKFIRRDSVDMDSTTCADLAAL
ncbi:MAG: hypothetical protein VXW22_02430 [Pseudomonadota bacterium]|nr:hypothetical protein [Pseudomonadota bacterium]